VHGFIDLHCHYLPAIDDGARERSESLAMLRALRTAGFERVIATPHMRPGMFDNTRSDLEKSFADFAATLEQEPDLPELGLSSEHYFDDVVFGRLLSGDALPYPGGRAALLEFYEIDFPPQIDHRLFDLRRRQLLPVIAHPERYRCLWRSPETLERLIDGGAAALLDSAALVGKYGKKAQACAETLLERGLYHAACSDAHRPADVVEVSAGIARIAELYGNDEVDFLLREGPTSLLAGIVPE
jgi:protein-tyrosine phosphatase